MTKSRAFTHTLVCLLIVTAIAACYQSVRVADFVWDDRINLKDNPFIRDFSIVNLKWMATQFYMGHYHPLTWLSLALDYQWYGMEAGGYHLTNLVLHAIGSMLVYALSWQVLRRIAPDLSGTKALLFCTVSALLFAIHPTRVESVAWVTERRDMLSFVFIALFFLCWNRYLESDQSRRRQWYLLAILAFTISLLCKAWGITIPAVLIALDYTYYNRLPLRWERFREHAMLWVEKLPHLLLSAVCAVLAYHAQQSVAMDMVRDHTSFDRTIQAGYGIAFYLWKSIYPHPLSPLYLIKDNYDPMAWPYLQGAIVGYLLVVVSTCLLFTQRERWRFLLGGFFFYLITLAPVLGFTQSGQQLTADRYTYIACIPLIFALVLGIIRKTPLPVAATILAGVIASFALLTVSQAKLWQNEITLWTHAIELDPENYVAQNNLGLALEDEGNKEQAYIHYDLAVQLFPEYAAALYNRGNMRSQRGDTEGAMTDYNAALMNDDKLVKAYNNRANLHRDAGEYEASLTDFNSALAINPGYADAYYNRGLTYRAMNRNEEAIADYNRAIQYNPRFIQAYNNLANAYRLIGRDEEAVRYYKQALAINPRYFNAYFNCGNALRELGRNVEAVTYYLQAAKLNPMHPDTFGNLGISLWKLDRPKEADACFRTSIKLDPRQPATRFNYAQFLRVQGRSDEAIGQLHVVLTSTDQNLELHRNAQEVLDTLLARQGK